MWIDAQWVEPPKLKKKLIQDWVCLKEPVLHPSNTYPVKLEWAEVLDDPNDPVWPEYPFIECT